jgi:hypothetical protein
MKYKFFTFLVLVVMTLLFSSAPNANAGCTASAPTWSPNPAPWKNTATGQTFNFTQNYTTGNDPIGDAAVLTDSCTTGTLNGDKCQVTGVSLISYQDFNPCPENRDAVYQSPVNRIDTVAPSCGTWSGSGPTFTLSGSTDAASGINVSGGSCTATPGNSCNVIISDIAGNTKSCVSPVREEQFYTVTASATNGYVDTPPVNPQQIASGEKATFHFNSGTGNTPTISGCPAGTGPSYDPVNIYWSYTTGPITANCTVTATFPVTPALSCAVHTATTPPPYYPNLGVKFLAAGGTGTYSWSAPNATPSSGTGNQIWPAWSTTGTKTVTVTSGAQTANCTVEITSAPVVNPMTGTISASDCEISVGNNSCNSTITWTTSYPEGSSSVTTPTSITVGTGLNNTAGYPVVYGSRMFYLYNNDKKLAEDGASATCTAGTTWNGSLCEAMAPTLPDLTADAPTPSVATVNVPQTFYSVISNAGGVSTGASFYNFFQVASGSNGSGTLTNLTASSTSSLSAYYSRTVSSPTHIFTATGTYSVRACADKSNPISAGSITEANESNNCSVWTNVTVGSSVGTVTGYHDAYSGTVPASQCRADGWAAYSNDKALDLNIRILSDGVQVATGVASTYRGDLETAGVCTGGTCSFWINLAGLISTGVNHTITAQAQNPGDNSWVTLPASPKTLNCSAGTTGTLTATNCEIKKNENSCNSALTWSVTSPVGTSNITSNTPSANTVITTGNSGTNFSVSVPYSSRTFFLNNNSAPLASVTPTATCVSGTVWDGAKCMEPASPPADPVCGDSIVESPETCDDGINSGSCSTSSCTKSCTVNTMCGGGGSPINGKCPIPAKHYSCSVGASINNVNGISSWTWNCSGINGGASASCTEMKKKPGYKEE